MDEPERPSSVASDPQLLSRLQSIWQPQQAAGSAS